MTEYLPNFRIRPAFTVIVKIRLTCERMYFWKDSERKDQRNTLSEEPQIAASDTGWKQLTLAENRMERNVFPSKKNTKMFNHNQPIILTESTEQSVPDRSKWTRQLG